MCIGRRKQMFWATIEHSSSRGRTVYIRPQVSFEMRVGEILSLCKEDDVDKPQNAGYAGSAKIYISHQDTMMGIHI